MGRHKIFAREKCPHLNKKTGKSDCIKLGRYPSNPMPSWNNKRKLDRKREYAYFIHDDGSRHFLGNYEGHWLKKIKGHAFEDIIRFFHIKEKQFGEGAIYLDRIRKTIPQWTWQDAEEQDLIDALKRGNLEPIKNKYDKFKRKERKENYKDYKEFNEQQYRFHDSKEFQDIDELTKKIFGELSDLTSDSIPNKAEIELKLEKLSPEEREKIIIRRLELLEGYNRLNNDRINILQNKLDSLQ